jgi:hypothetical protein
MATAARIPWLRVERRLRNAETYWLATTRPDGRPHCMPLWGVWIDGVLWFWTPSESVKARNLVASPFAVVHLDGGDEVVILEGRVSVPDDADQTAAALAAYAHKYNDFDVTSERLGDAHCLRPTVAHAWVEALLDETRSRWEPIPEIDRASPSPDRYFGGSERA